MNTGVAAPPHFLLMKVFKKKTWFLCGSWVRGGVQKGKIGILEAFQQRWSHI